MQNKNQSIVKIDYQALKGLIMKWNFNGHLNKVVYYRHIIIIDVDQQQYWKQFLNLYYDKIKAGDLITLSYETKQSEFNRLRWKQKQYGSALNIINLKLNRCQLNSLISMIDDIIQKTKQLSQPIIVNFLTDRKNKQIRTIQQHINRKRAYGMIPFLFSFFGYEPTDLNITRGFLHFDIKNQKIQQTLSCYKSHIAQIAFLKVKISVQCSNGLLSSQDCDNWRNQTFRKISHQIYGPPIKYDQDIIHLLNEDPSDIVTYNLNITLEFTQLTGRQYRTDKNIVVTAENQRIYLRTVGNRIFQSGLDLGKGVYCQRNPFRSMSYIWFKNPKCEYDDVNQIA